MDIEDEGIEECEKESKTLENNLNLILSLLNKFRKEYEVVYWSDGEGVDIIVTELSDVVIDNGFKPYKQVISLNMNEYLQFEKQEEEVK